LLGKYPRHDNPEAIVSGFFCIFTYINNKRICSGFKTAGVLFNE